MKSGALELGPYKITVNALIPGLIDTPLTRHKERYAQVLQDADRPSTGSSADEQEAREVLTAKTPLGVPWIEPADVAPVVVFFASDAARMVSGATYDVTAPAIRRDYMEAATGTLLLQHTLETAMHQIIRVLPSLVLLASTANVGLTAELSVPVQPDWASAGQNNHNTRYAATEHTINADNVGSLKPKWTFTTAGDVSATATVVNEVAYVPDWGGKLWAIDAKTGKAIWSQDISDYTGTAGTASRTSPAYWDGELVIGTGNLMTPDLSGAFEIGVDARTGAKLWRTKTDPSSAALMTGSATIDNGIVCAGVSSKTEHTTLTPTFRGSVVALDARTGKIKWQSYMVPNGFNGGVVWMSQPVVDHETGMLYVTTGNSYSVPKGYCVNPGQTNCKVLPPDAHIDSIVALSLTTGKVAWVHHTLNADTWTMSKPNTSPDFDFGAGPNLYTTTVRGKKTDVLGAGQKSGMYYALEPATGKLIWETQAGPGGVLGGIEWGTATDGERIYAAISNGSHKTYTYITFDGQKRTTTGGLWTALDAATGKILWQTAAPENPEFITDGFVSSANGVVYAGSSGGNFYAINAKTGQIEWTFPSGGAVWSGAAIVDGTVYWGSGYDTKARKLPYDGNNNKLYAFSLRGR